MASTITGFAYVVATEKQLYPAVGTVITNEGKVVRHDVTRYGLHRMCVAVKDKYPDVETWFELLKNKPLIKIKTRYAEKIVAGVFIGYLWFYWKEG